MELITIILSGLALIAATVCLTVVCMEKKRNEKRNTAAIQYADHACKSALDAAREYTDEKVAGCRDRIEKLEKGIIPDYEQAKAAANAVNDFSKGISNILGFDPMEALKADRAKKEAGGSG